MRTEVGELNPGTTIEVSEDGIPEPQRTEPQRAEEKVACRWKGGRLCRAEALAYMPILRTNHVV